MPIHADRNLYPGINAHLNSFLQHEPGGWESFHLEHLVDLRHMLDENMPLHYYARMMPSMQLSVSSENQEGVLNAVIIYQIQKGNLLGVPVARIELLSAASKPGGPSHGQYMSRRLELLRSGIPLVEIDYLHQTPPIVRVIPSYVDHEADASPYMILVTDPRPTFEETVLRVYEFGVVELMPIIPIPLTGTEVMNIHFSELYHQTFANSRFFRLVVDYAEDPVHFDRYHDVDRQVIRQRLNKIRITRKTDS